jgi:D-alanine transaminase
LTPRAPRTKNRGVTGKGGQSMSRIVYVNGAYVPEEEAKVSVFDRGFLFADGVYEVTSVLDGRLVDFPGHAWRLARSLKELEMPAPATDDELLAIHRELVARNGVTEGLVYLQVTRGAADRDFAYPAGAAPTLVLFTQTKRLADSPTAAAGIRVISIPDLRWGRRDIKTVQLLYPSMGKMMAKAAGVDDAWMVEDGLVTEGTSNNAYIVTKAGRIVTRQLGPEILQGITRTAVLRFAAEAQMEVEERAFTLEEAQDAAEAFITSATTFVTPVVEIDGHPVGTGAPGTVARRLREIYLDESRKSAV